MKELNELGFKNLALVDSDGYVVKEFGTMEETVFPLVEKALELIHDSEYVVWGVEDSCCIVYPIDGGFILIGKPSREMPLSKAIFLKGDIRKKP